jgi:hypothetical protein
VGVRCPLVWELPISTALPLMVEGAVGEALLPVAPIAAGSDLAPSSRVWDLAAGPQTQGPSVDSGMFDSTAGSRISVNIILSSSSSSTV